MTPATYAVLGLAATVAGAINAVAGGGSLVTFPIAVAAGLPGVVANATNTVALLPGSLAAAWAYRREVRATRRALVQLAPAALVGGALGMRLLLVTPAALFDALVPWLVFGATLLVAAQDLVKRLRATTTGQTTQRAPRVLVAVIAELLVATYGGYFGAGIGILMLALLVLLEPMTIHEMNAVKSVLAAIINGVAAAGFVIAGVADARACLAMAGGAILGGFFGARVARRAPASAVRALVLVVGFGLSAMLAARRWL